MEDVFVTEEDPELVCPELLVIEKEADGVVVRLLVVEEEGVVLKLLVVEDVELGTLEEETVGVLVKEPIEEDVGVIGILVADRAGWSIVEVT